MHGRTFLALGGMLLVIGAAVAQTANDPVEDINRLDKDRQLKIINQLIVAQEQIQRALKRMLAGTAPVGGPDPSSGEHDGSDESDEEEHKWQEMKRKKIAEARARAELYVKGIASNFLNMADYIEKIDSKVVEQLDAAQGHVNYNLYYKKPKPHHSSEESEEHDRYRKSSSRRGGRQLAVEPEEAPVVEQEEKVKTVDGEEVVQTLPVKGSE